MYRIHEIRLSLGEGLEIIPKQIQKKLRSNVEIGTYSIAKESIDARDKGDIQMVYTIDFEADGNLPGLEQTPDLTYHYPESGQTPLSSRPVIAGFGPCGMFAALILAQLGYRPLILERGRPVERRVEDVEQFWKHGILDEESNVQFGEGGAGTFSDGKLTSGIKDKRARKVLEELSHAGAGEEILYRHMPHIGTDVLRTTVVNLRNKIIELGGEIRFETRLTSIKTNKDGHLSSIIINENGQTNQLPAEALILAVGHSARDTLSSLHEAGLWMEQKPFSMGLRIEHLQENINKAQYGMKAAALLPPASYKLSHHCQNGRGVYTFCMCPGGRVIVASSQKGGVVTNGMSNQARDALFANSGLLVDVKTSDFESRHPLAGISFQQKYEQLAFANGGGDYQAPKTTWGEFACRAPSAKPVLASIPLFASEAIMEAMPRLARKLNGFDDPKAVLYAVESRSSSPVRIKRNDDYQSSIPGLYPGGEGAGYAGGIISAAVDGIRLAEKIVKNYSNHLLLK